MDIKQSRRLFLQKSLVAGVGLSLIDPFSAQAMMKKSKMKLGLVTYQWGKDWDLPTLIANCEKAGLQGVELRTQHAHGVETSLSASLSLRVDIFFRSVSLVPPQEKRPFASGGEDWFPFSDIKKDTSFFPTRYPFINFIKALSDRLFSFRSFFANGDMFNTESSTTVS